MPITLDELLEWKEKHPDETLWPCARFGGTVHLTRYVSRNLVETWCGLVGPTKLYALVFKLPKESVDCQKCLRLARV